MSTWLHGTLYVAVIEGRKLPKHKNLSIRYAAPSTIDGCLGGVEKLACASRPSKAYCTVNLGPTCRYQQRDVDNDTALKRVTFALHLYLACRARTNVLGHSSNPDWQEHFEILVADEVEEISFTVKDDNWIGASVSQGHVSQKQAFASSRFDFSVPACNLL